MLSFQAEVTRALEPGKNHLEIKVTHLWRNRMIGDEQPSAVKKHTFTDYRPHRIDSPLLGSGLRGPVSLSSVSPEGGSRFAETLGYTLAGLFVPAARSQEMTSTGWSGAGEI
jgi:hypothetical protein